MSVPGIRLLLSCFQGQRTLGSKPVKKEMSDDSAFSIHGKEGFYGPLGANRVFLEQWSPSSLSRNSSVDSFFDARSEISEPEAKDPACLASLSGQKLTSLVDFSDHGPFFRQMSGDIQYQILPKDRKTKVWTTLFRSQNNTSLDDVFKVFVGLEHYPLKGTKQKELLEAPRPGTQQFLMRYGVWDGLIKLHFTTTFTAEGPRPLSDAEARALKPLGEVTRIAALSWNLSDEPLKSVAVDEGRSILVERKGEQGVEVIAIDKRVFQPNLSAPDIIKDARVKKIIEKVLDYFQSTLA